MEIKKIFNQGIRIYQKIFFSFIAPLLKLLFPVECRFYPTCSDYAREAIQEYGIFKGTGMSIKRIGRCHPFHGSGIDLVPPKKAEI